VPEVSIPNRLGTSEGITPFRPAVLANSDGVLSCGLNGCRVDFGAGIVRESPILDEGILFFGERSTPATPTEGRSVARPGPS
jgi:hypothetical protein